ncbi:helix-turn-helix domain-containing protein [Rubrobacter tropicus]|nr:helix-turn-helix domain-containing protein [Rubrobacter tropicus]
MTINLPTPMYTVSEAAKLIGCYRTHVYKIVHRGDLEATTDDTGQLRVSREELYRYLKQREED